MKGGKAKNLLILSKIDGINVPRFIELNSGMSEPSRADAIASFLSSLPDGSTVAVRSNAVLEDSSSASFAGMYATKLRVPAKMQEVCAAVDEVSVSGAEKGAVVTHYAASRNVELSNTDVAVIVQEMIDGDMSGVVFSHDLATRDGYYVISVSNGTGEAIVGGASNGKLIRVVRGIEPKSIKEAWLQQLVCAMVVIEKRFRSTSMDVEFVFKDGKLYILQCRAITAAQGVTIEKDQEAQLRGRIDLLNKSIASSFGGDVLGDMIDVNPLELLGAAPTPLDTSIFNYLFAERIVEKVRRDMGYDPLDTGLFRIIEGKPYASMRATAFSFRPSGIPNRIYERMVCVYRDALVENPALQNRVEFDLYAMSCGDKLEQVMEKAELDERDKRIVRGAFSRIDSVFRDLSESCARTLGDSTRCYEEQTLPLADVPLDDVLEHVAVGTEMFVRIARLAFYWKNKFGEMHPRESLNDLIAGHIHSANGQLQADLVACRDGLKSRQELIKQYGHLRPGQFSVFGESYADDPENYLFTRMDQAEAPKIGKRTHAFERAPEFQYAVTFMQAREQMKFLFAKALHLFATKLKQQLDRRGISRKDASRVSWEELSACLRGSSELKVARNEECPPVLLPDVVIPSITDLKVITFTQATPSYITGSVVKAGLCMLERAGVKADVKGTLVLLPNADPGYDFLFHSGAAGIITKVGGPASHMCIRAIELQMPACIGCGENMYQMLSSARSAVLDCSSRQIIIPD